MSLASWLRFAAFPRTRSLNKRPGRQPRQRAMRSLHLEQLETRLTPSLSLATLASFNGANGSSPEASLVMDGSGNLYGTTYNGGASSDGTIFELVHGSSTLTTLASFNGSNGDNPSGVIMDSSGNLYGDTLQGGANNAGTVFELAAGSGTITTLASLSGGGTYDGVNGVIMDSSSNLYGIHSGFNVLNQSVGETLFELPHGSSTVTTLASFPTGSSAKGSLVMDSSGNLYGTASLGGSSGEGSVFELAAGSSTIITLASFNGGNGLYPDAGPIRDSSGNLYGTTFEGGASGEGTVFELAAGSSTITTLASFNGTNGAYPLAPLLRDSSGNLYGTTSSWTQGGTSSQGTVFELATGSSTITTLATFNGTNGSDPVAGLIMDSSGNLYGTTEQGGASSDGTVFELGAFPSFTVTGFPSPTTAGVAGSFTVTALNANGTVNTGYLGTVSFTSSDGQAVLPANYTFTTADQGVHTFTATLKTAGTQSITATDTVTSSTVGSETGITVNPAAAASLVFSSVPSSTTAGSAFTLTLTAKDAYGNVATGYAGTVKFSSSDAKAVLPANYTLTSSDAGIHTFTITLETAGTQSVTATDTVTSSITGTASGIVVNAAAASTLSITGLPSTVTLGTAYTFTVTAQDAYGNAATGYRGTVKFSSSDKKATLPANYTFTAADNGVHTFTNGVKFKTTGSQTLTATDTVTSTITGTATVTVSSGKGSALLVSPIAQATASAASANLPLPASLLSASQADKPVMPLCWPAAPAAPQTGAGNVAPASATVPASHLPATDAVFAAAGQAATDDNAWLFGSLSGNLVDGI